MDQQLQQSIPQLPAASHSYLSGNYTLYLQPGDPNSDRAFQIAAPLGTMIEKVNAKDIPKANRPSFLIGTPCIVDRFAKTAYRGMTCLSFLQKLVTDMRENVSGLSKKDASLIGVQPPQAGDFYTIETGYQDRSHLYQTGRVGKDADNMAALQEQIVGPLEATGPQNQRGELSEAEKKRILQEQILEKWQ
eukprot:gnl/Hemi2/2285_TR813_c0_g1_i1.p1 gnl/Hemi2/2285_TR813_c0_g1~~gnl/Hemi2/2285_TR813_c0_g1_i1.p1  ORF type:complete len:201 (-),score=41.04 gnl/Hemi2/2285_TR813_c0_g1_i1:85-654(-)